MRTSLSDSAVTETVAEGKTPCVEVTLDAATGIRGARTATLGLAFFLGFGLLHQAVASPFPDLSIEREATGAIAVRVDGADLTGWRLEKSRDLIKWETLQELTEPPFVYRKVPGAEPNKKFFRLARGPAPVTVTPIFDATQGTGKVVGNSGGSVSVTSSNGITYTLELPAGALLSPVEITMTPLTGLEDLPFSGGLVSGVRLEPDALQLFASATLTIEGGAVEEHPEGLRTTGFAYHGDGEDFHLFPIKSEEGAATFSIIHFSGYGTGLASGDDVANQRQNHPPQSESARSTQNMPDDAEEVIDWLMDIWHRAVHPMLERATTDEGSIHFAFVQFMFWLNAVRQAGMEELFRGAEVSPIRIGYEMFAVAIENAINKAEEKCHAENDPHQAVVIYRWLLWASREPDIAQHLDFAELTRKAERCATFELSFSSVIHLTSHGATWARGEVEAQVLLKPLSLVDLVTGLPTGDMHWIGEDTTHYLSHENALGDTACEKLIGTRNSMFLVEEMYINLNLPLTRLFSSDPDDIPLAPLVTWDVTMLINPGDPAEVWSVSVASSVADCPAGPWEEEDDYWWNDSFFALHYFDHGEAEKLEIVHDDPAINFWLLIDDWDTMPDPADPAVIARKAYELEDGGTFRWSESTLLELRHVPQ